MPRRFPGPFDRYSGVYRASARVGVALVDGPGAPFATIVLEELAALGVERFVIVGLAGSLRSGIAAGSVVLCTKALRDEGTSHHYPGPAKYAHPDRPLTKILEQHLQHSGVSCLRGASWTTDAVYRETRQEIRRYRRAGILTVEMEAAAVFAVARRIGAKTAALFVISDHLSDAGWDPRFHETRKPLRRVLNLAMSALDD